MELLLLLLLFAAFSMTFAIPEETENRVSESSNPAQQRAAADPCTPSLGTPPSCTPEPALRWHPADRKAEVECLHTGSCLMQAFDEQLCGRDQSGERPEVWDAFAVSGVLLNLNGPFLQTSRAPNID
nr:uncharacterized protein LOC106823528 isoform X2 [Equus asinus]